MRTSSRLIDKYQSWKIELEQLWKVKIIMVIPVVVGALGAIANRLPGWVAQIPGTISEVELQKRALLGTAKSSDVFLDSQGSGRAPSLRITPPMVGGERTFSTTTVSEVADMARTYQWVNKSNFRANTGALIMAAQEQALNTSAISHEIYHTVQDPRCGLC